MTPEDRRNIVRGLVLDGSRWVTIEKRVQAEALRRQKIEKGLVLFQGEWVTIEEKLARVTPAQQAPAPASVTYNINTDNRTYHQHNIHEHRHVHIDGQTAAEAFGAQRLDDQPPGQLGGDQERRHLPGSQKRSLPPPRPKK